MAIATEESEMQVGYGAVDITPRVGAPLAGVVSRKGRFCRTIRDPLQAKALHVSTPQGHATIVSADLLVITKELHAEVVRRTGSTSDALLLSATHTHSGPGGYWDAGRGHLFMGAYDPSELERLAEGIEEAVRRARRDLRRTHMLGASVDVAGANANRRELHGPVDRELSLLRFVREGAPPIDVVSFGAHPVIGCERAPDVCSADFPGELCARIERRGSRAMFVQGAVGGLSPLFSEFPMRLDEHLELVGGVLAAGYDRAVDGLSPLASSPFLIHTHRVPIAPTCTIFPHRAGRWALAELAASPLRHWMLGMARDAKVGRHAPMHVLRIGDACLVGTPCDLGVRVALAIKRVVRRAGVAVAMVGSHCDAYVGYVHLPEDYDAVPEPGFRAMSFYENAMSLSGRDLGRAMVESIRGDAAFLPTS